MWTDHGARAMRTTTGRCGAAKRRDGEENGLFFLAKKGGFA